MEAIVNMIPGVAVVGCGYWGKNLVRNFSQLGALRGVSDRNQPLLQGIASEYKVPAFSFQDLLDNQDVRGVVIAVPAEHHFYFAKEALLAGKHVFVEKPLALDVEDAQELCALAEQQKKILMVGHLLQYHAGFLKLKEMVNKGDLGRIEYIYSNRLNFGKIRQEENILWSFAPHDLSMILSLAGQLPLSVFTKGSCHLNKHIHDTTTTHLKFKTGLEAHIFVSWLHPYKEQKLVVIGTKAMIVFDDGQPWSEKLAFYPHTVDWVKGVPTSAKADKILIPLEEEEPLKKECQHFLDCIEREITPRTDGFEGLGVLKVLDASQKSLDNEKKVFLNCTTNETPSYFCHDSSYVDEGVEIGEGTKIWHFSHILQGTRIGKNCIVGQNVMIGPDVVVGNQCKIQNNVSIYKGVHLDDGVFCGPSCVFTNVHNPRALIERKNEFRSTHVEKGVTIGANATIMCGVRLGAYSFVGAGAVVTKDVKPHAIMVGNPAKQVGWISHAGKRLGEDLLCSLEGRQYEEREGMLVCL